MASIIGVETLQHTNGTTAMEIDSSGRVTKPNNICFFAYIDANTSVSASGYQTVPFDATEFNVGNCYSTSTYRFTPTVAGYYQLNVAVNPDMTSGTSGRFFGRFYKNGNSYAQFGHAPSYSSDRVIITGSIVMHFNGSTDYAYIMVSSDGGTTMNLNGGTSNFASHFSGHLVG